MITDSRVSSSSHVERRAWALMAVALGLVIAVATLMLPQLETWAAQERGAPGMPPMTPLSGEPLGRPWARPALLGWLAEPPAPSNGTGVPAGGFAPILERAWPAPGSAFDFPPSAAVLRDPPDDVPHGWHPSSPSCDVRPASRTDREHRYAFAKLINGYHANTLEEAVRVEAGDVLTFTYIVTNTGDFYIVLDALTDDVFGDLTAHCDLLDRVEIAAGDSVSCDFITQADRAQEGKKNTAIAFVWCLEEQSAAAWYRTPPPTAITLLSFQAQPTGGSVVRLTWETATEPSLQAFRIYRAAHTQGPSAPVADVPAAGQPGAAYTHTDTVPGDGFWTYWLKGIEWGGYETTLHGPVRVGVNTRQLFLPLVVKP